MPLNQTPIQLPISHIPQLADLRHPYLQLDFKPHAELVFDVLGATKTFELAALHHDAHLGTQGFGLLHQMRRENHGTGLLSSDIADYFPHEATGFWIHARRRLIQKNDGWVAHNGYRYGQLSFVSP